MDPYTAYNARHPKHDLPLRLPWQAYALLAGVWLLVLVEWAVVPLVYTHKWAGELRAFLNLRRWQAIYRHKKGLIP